MNRTKKKMNKSRVWFLVFCITLPLMNFLVFYVYPNLSSFTMAFTSAKGEWGFENFARFGRELMRPESDLRFALKNTFLTFGILFVTFPLKVLVSYFIYKKVPGHAFFRVVFFLPTIILPLAVALVFERMVGVNGFIAQTIGKWMEVEYVPELLADSRFANTTVLIHMVWLAFPGDLIIWGGTFSRIPEDMLESARIDGVTWWTEFTKIIVPLVWPTVALQMILLICGLFSSSGQVWLLTEGQYGTMTMSSWLYKMLYENSGSNYTSNVYNYLSAVGLIITTIAIILSVFTRKYTSKVFKEVEF